MIEPLGPIPFKTPPRHERGMRDSSGWRPTAYRSHTIGQVVANGADMGGSEVTELIEAMAESEATGSRDLAQIALSRGASLACEALRQLGHVNEVQDPVELLLLLGRAAPPTDRSQKYLNLFIFCWPKSRRHGRARQFPFERNISFLQEQERIFKLASPF